MMWRDEFVRRWCRTAMAAAAVALFATPAFAQTGRITGTVTSADGQAPVAGAQVFVGGTSYRAITGTDGRYTIVAQPGTYMVRAMRIGFSPDSMAGVVVLADQATTVDFRLKAAAALLEGVVVVGYGTQEARDRTGVVASVSSEEFNAGQVVSAEQLIQSKVAGVQIVESGEPGGGIALRIRGGTSVNASNDPLYVIDGVPLQVGAGISNGRNPLNFLNPDDIENITVLKDASSTAIYGSRGANGVVMITTKSGSSSMRLNYSSTVSSANVINEPDMLTAEQFRAAVQANAPDKASMLGSANTDWRDAVQQSATGIEHNLTLSGSRQDLNYRFSLGYLDQEGVVLGTQLERISGSMNYSDNLFNDALTVRASLIGTKTEDWFTPGGVISGATQMAPTQPIRTDSGYFEWPQALAVNNPVAELDLISDRGTLYRSIGKIEGEYFLPWVRDLSATLRLGYDVAKGERTGFFPSTLQAQRETSTGGTFTRSSPTQTNTLLDFFVNYGRQLEQFQSDLDFTAGYSWEETRGDFPFIRATGLSTDLLGPNGIPAAQRVTPTLFIDESRLASVFGRVNYSLRDKYLATFTVRRDGSSKFGPGNQWGTFPSAAFAWRVIDEAFMSGLPSVSDLKLRFSWGKNGNQAIGNYQQYSSYLPGDDATQVQFGNEFIPTIRPSAADPNIKWEETTSWNFGIDYGIANNRVTGAIEFYHKETDDLLFSVPVAAGTNLSNFVTTNIGSMENDGFELSLNALLMTGARGGLTWNASFNASTNSNKLTQINPFGESSTQILTGGIAGGVGSTIQVLQTGQPVNSFFVYQHKRNADGTPVYEDTNGDGNITEIDLYEDLNGDGAITQSDRRPYKSPQPKWILGHSSQMQWKQFDASFTLRGYFGNYVYNNVASNLGNYEELTRAAPFNLHSSVLRTNFTKPQYFSDVYVEDASFIRMDNIAVGYTFRNLRQVSQVRIFGAIQNAFTITDYSGVDPLAGLNGIDNNIYPFSRTYSAGVNIGF